MKANGRGVLFNREAIIVKRLLPAMDTRLIVSSMMKQVEAEYRFEWCHSGLIAKHGTIKKCHLISIIQTIQIDPMCVLHEGFRG